LQNRFSHWVWRQYASAFWDDVRIDRVLPFQAAKDTNDERHIHPLQLDVIDRALVLWSNPDEVVLTPFMGVGSEVYGAINAGRKAVGIELKPTYYRQAVRNVERAHLREGNQEELSTVLSDDGMDEVEFDEGERNLVSRSGRWLGKS
jgi:DNA modification methylase